MAEGNSFLDKVIRPVLAEFIGTTLFVFSVCLFPAIYTILSGLLQGFAYVSLIAGLGKFSGGHFNPAITAAVTLCGGVSILVAICYILAQMLGGLIGAALVLGILSERDYVSSVGGATILRSGTEPGWGVLTEAILTFMLILTVLMTTMDEKKHKLAPLAIGFAVTVGVMAGESVTGGSMNPARSLGPAVSTLKYKVDGVWEYHYIYWVGPFAGLLVATLIYSGGYFNPAITFALTLNGALPVLVAVCFFIAQIGGGLLGGALALAAVPTNKYTQFIGGATMLINKTEPGWAILIEGILTFIVTFIVLLTTLDKNKKKMSPLAVGFSFIACALSGEPYTGGSMNPARSLGPAASYSRYLYFNVWEHHYVYWVGPIAGALVAAIIYRVLFAKRRAPDYMTFKNSEEHSTPSNNIPIQ